MRSLKDLGGVYLRGVLMGAADVIPGVSGGTIAFITGIYETLIKSLNAIDLLALKYFFTFKWKSLVDKINLRFLLTLVVGVFTAVLSLARLLKHLLHTYPEAVWAFFFGLIVASVIIIAKHIKHWSIANIVALIIGAGVAWWLTSTSVIQTPNTPLFIFFAGIISIIAMILPGISGSFILVILDKYRYIIDLLSDISIKLKDIISGIMTGDMAMTATAWDEMTLTPILIFEAGTLVGIIGFSRVLNWLFKKYYALTISILTGFLIGSLNKVWPWKEAVEFYTDRHGELQPLVEQNILPTSYGSYFFLSVGLAIFGFLAVYLLESYSSRKKAIDL